MVKFARSTTTPAGNVVVPRKVIAGLAGPSARSSLRPHGPTLSLANVTGAWPDAEAARPHQVDRPLPGWAGPPSPSFGARGSGVREGGVPHCGSGLSRPFPGIPAARRAARDRHRPRAPRRRRGAQPNTPRAAATSCSGPCGSPCRGARAAPGRPTVVDLTTRLIAPDSPVDKVEELTSGCSLPKGPLA